MWITITTASQAVTLTASNVLTQTTISTVPRELSNNKTDHAKLESSDLSDHHSSTIPQNYTP